MQSELYWADAEFRMRVKTPFLGLIQLRSDYLCLNSAQFLKTVPLDYELAL
jgi:hypothetical protein